LLDTRNLEGLFLRGRGVVLKKHRGYRIGGHSKLESTHESAI
jgi:hypothetical protein